MHKEKIYQKLINLKKPISIEKFIEISLFDHEGYYTNSKVIGSEGDFITSPEISQLFGEILGLYIFNYWQNNLKKKFNLIELGPGKGTLLSDFLRITKKFKEFNKALNIQLIEKNMSLIEIQKINLRNQNLNINKIKWAQDFTRKYKEPIIVLANEFFDCFPIKQFYKKNDLWFEKMVTYDVNEKFLKIVDIEIKNKKTLKSIDDYQPVDILEISRSREKYFTKICKQLLTVGGMLIAIDYGYLEKPKNFTLQSIYRNQPTNILENIGYQDITSLVDFKILLSIAKSYKLTINLFTTQRDFLIKNGIYERLKKILAISKNSQKNTIKSGFERIIDKNYIGSAFKILIVSNTK